MATLRGNFFILSRRALLWSATFIMLSGVVIAERQCYWCGPLAEQVHRSRRAPPCDLPTNHVTTCEPGLDFCAVVATSPPYVESRLCVKLYQDECYPLFCNSTRTWKMTCPCREDLCNGNNTEREIEAFAGLAKLVAKSQNNRIKKREISSASSSIRERTIIITNITELNQTNEALNEINEDQMIVVTGISRLQQPTRDISVDIVNPPTLDLKENPRTETTSAEKPSSEHPSTENPIHSGSEQQESSENPVFEETTQKDITNKITELDTTHLTTQNDKDTVVMKSGTTNSITEPSLKEIGTTTPITTITMKLDIKENKTHNTRIKSNEQLPTAEALQQTVSPSITSIKTTESIKMESTDTNTVHETTTVEPKGGDNSATRLSLNAFTILSILFVVYL